MADVAHDEYHEARDRPTDVVATASDLERVRNTLDARITQEANRLDVSIAGLREDMVRLDGRIDTTAAEIRAEIAGVRTEIAGLDGRIAEIATGLDGKIDRVAVQLDGKIDTVAAEIRTEIAGSANRVVVSLGAGMALLAGLMAAIQFFG